MSESTVSDSTVSESAGSDRARPRLTVIGEALIDLVPGDSAGSYQARPGGSPFNVAIGLARLGHRTTLMARMADNAFGRLLRRLAAAEGIDLSAAPLAAEPTTLAVVGLDSDGRASYDFYLEGTADWQWSAAEMALAPADTAIFQLGSLASWTPPGSELIHAAAAALHRAGAALVSYDPNVRPALLGAPARARPLVERSVSVAHLVKASRDDIGWLYPEATVEQVAGRWLELGALLVVITDGPDGALVFPADGAPVRRPGREVKVADTIGAGDAFSAGLLGGLARRGLLTPDLLRSCPPGLLADVVDEAVLVSALTCERTGADPPRAAAGAWSKDGVLTPADLTFAPPSG
ncbi:MAG TPA: carbohydrate kinase [Trebonia sp.]|nr:carbohydrate kinase [Trebonia sp.]